MTQKKYLSKIKKTINGTKQDVYIKDVEARDQLPSLATENAVRSIVTNYGNN